MTYCEQMVNFFEDACFNLTKLIHSDRALQTVPLYRPDDPDRADGRRVPEDEQLTLSTLSTGARSGTAAARLSAAFRELQSNI